MLPTASTMPEASRVKTRVATQHPKPHWFACTHGPFIMKEKEILCTLLA
jgi:hypothetical protein